MCGSAFLKSLKAEANSFLKRANLRKKYASNGTSKNRIANVLMSALGDKLVSQERAIIRKNSFDALRVHRGFPIPQGGFPPDFLVTPRSQSDIIKLVKIARQYRIPIIPRGGGTGLMGAAVATKGGIIVDYTKMQRVLEVSETDQSVMVQPGATLGGVNRKLKSKHLFLGHDPWTRDYATVGGAISTNGIGYYGAKYGSMGDQVLGLKAVLADGTEIDTPAVPSSSTGMDLRRLLIGTEGTFGLITQATMRCFPIPESEVVFGYSFPNFEKAFSAVLSLRDRDVVPSSIDIIGEGYDGSCEFYIVFNGFKENVRACERKSRTLLEKSGGRRLAKKKSSEYWEERHSIADLYEESISKSPLSSWRGEKTFDFLHVGLQARNVVSFQKRITEIARGNEIDILEYGCWIRPEFFGATFTREEDVPAANLRRTVDEGTKLALKMGGSIEYTHGVGVRLAGFMRAQHGRGFDVMKKFKRLLDPDNILNPGKLGL